MKFRKKPVVIEAVQLNSSNYLDVFRWISTENGRVKEWSWDNDTEAFPERYLLIETLEGDMKAEEFDWVIKGVGGEFYPCKHYIFEMTYEEVQE